MDLIPECVFHTDLDEPIVAGPGPTGTRMVIPVADGWIKGSRLNASVVGPGGDWALIGDDGFARLDVRGHVRTDDDAIIDVSYAGLLELCRWLNTTMFVGQVGSPQAPSNATSTASPERSERRGRRTNGHWSTARHRRCRVGRKSRAAGWPVASRGTQHARRVHRRGSTTSGAGARADQNGLFNAQASGFTAPDCKVTIRDGRTATATVTLAGCTPSAIPVPAQPAAPTGTCVIVASTAVTLELGAPTAVWFDTTGCDTTTNRGATPTPVQWKVVAGVLPAGMTGPNFQGTTGGNIIGTPGIAGTYRSPCR